MRWTVPASVLLAGCVPYVTSYVHVDALELPALSVNGAPLPSQRVRFERRVHAVIAPFSC